MQYLVLVRTVHAHVLRRAVVGDFVVEGGKLRHFDEVAETLLLHHVVRHVELEVGRLLWRKLPPMRRNSGCPAVPVPSAQILEEQVQFRQLLDGRAGQERSPKSLPVRSCMVRMAKAYSGLSGFLPSFPTRHTVMPGVESQVLELVARPQRCGRCPSA